MLASMWFTYWKLFPCFSHFILLYGLRFGQIWQNCKPNSIVNIFIIHEYHHLLSAVRFTHIRSILSFSLSLPHPLSLALDFTFTFMFVIYIQLKCCALWWAVTAKTFNCFGYVTINNRQFLLLKLQIRQTHSFNALCIK